VTATLEPTAEQRAVIGLAPDARVFVIAGPGAGKTWALLQRAVQLTGDDGLAVGELLVLSFTRAVVAELRRRDRFLTDPSRIRPETFDSFATRLLAEHATDESWRSAGFDGRMTAATHLLKDGSALSGLEDVRHILLDEVQDLVGVRAAFVAALLRAHPGGFTAFGDPAQAIYDHERGRHDDGLLDDLAGVADEVLELNGNHRASGALAEVARQLRTVLLEEDTRAAADAVTEAFGDLATLGESEALGTQLASMHQSAAVLCRDNATALLLSEAFHRDHVRHRVRRGSTDRPVAGWVAGLFAGRASLTRAALAERHAQLVEVDFPGLMDVETAWRALSRLDAQARSGAVREREVRQRIALGGVPWELYDEPIESLVISSVHRAKGLEFDQCVIVEWSPRKEADQALEARVLFVALTRARRECWHAEGWHGSRWFRSREAQDRLIKHGRERWQTFGIEVRGGDAHAPDPAGELGMPRPADEIQRLLIEAVRPGDDVILSYQGEHDYGCGLRPIYSVMHADHGPVGVTGRDFGDALSGRLRDRRRPSAITNVRVDDLETVAGSPDSGDAAGLGRTGLWLRPRLIGLGEFQWKT